MAGKIAANFDDGTLKLSTSALETGKISQQ